MRFERQKRMVSWDSSERSNFGAWRASNGGRHLHHNDRNSAQVDLCAHGTCCPFERFAAFACISAALRASSTQYAFFIAALNVRR
jgi:hypothetical protein